jgi:Rap1a immunity proteins
LSDQTVPSCVVTTQIRLAPRRKDRPSSDEAEPGGSILKLKGFIAPLLFMASPTWGQMVTGNDLIEACGGASGEQQGFCVGYIMGVTEGIRLGVGTPFMIEGTKTSEEINEISNSLLMYCAFPEVTAAQNIAVVKKFLNDNPEKLHFPARGLLLQAFQDAYKC